MSEPEQHHTVQKALLRGFANSQGFLMAHNRDGTVRRVASKHATAVDKFYGYTDRSGGLDLRVENALKGLIESPFPGLRELLQADGTLEGRDKEAFDRYVAYAMTRTRSVRAHMDHVDTVLRDHIIYTETRAHYNIDDSKMTPESKRFLLSFGQDLMTRFSTGDPNRGRLRTFVHTAHILQRRLAHLRWRHVTLGPAQVAITSDAAVVALRTHEHGGLLPPGTPVAIALGPASIAIAARPRALTNIVDESRLVDRVNRAYADTAHSQCFRHPETAWPEGLDLAPEPTPMSIQVVKPNALRRRGNAGDELRRRYRHASFDSFTRDLLAHLAADMDE